MIRTSGEYFWQMHLHYNTFPSLQNHPVLEDARDDLGLTVLLDHIRSGEHTLLVRQIELNPRCSLHKDCWGATLLHWAAVEVNMEAVAVLLTAGASVNATCKRGMTVLHWAVISCSVTCCQTILDAGAAIDHRDKHGFNAVMLCVWTSPGPEHMIGLLLQAGSDVQAQDIEGATALIHAVRFDSPGVCSMLLNYGADIDHRTHGGSTPISNAIVHNRHSSLQLLMDRGASKLSLDGDGNSIVCYAARYADINTMRILQEARIEGLRVDTDMVECYWKSFDERDDVYVGDRAPIKEEKDAFQALLNSIVPSTNPLPQHINRGVDVPGAFPLDPVSNLEITAHPDMDKQTNESDVNRQDERYNIDKTFYESNINS
jgi:ankyrin repeat protein